MTYIFFTIISLFCGACSPIQQLPQPHALCLDTQSVQTITLQEDPYFQHLIMPVYINGHIRHLVIDSGGNFQLNLQKDTLRKMGLKYKKTVKQSRVENVIKLLKCYHALFSVDLFKTHSVDVMEYQPWGISFNDIPPKDQEHELSVVMKNLRQNPEYIGIKALKKYNFLINASELKMQFFERNTPYALCSTWEKIPFYETPQGIEIDVIISDAKSRAVLDTGASVSFNMKNNPSLNPKPQHVMLMNGHSVILDFIDYPTEIKDFPHYIFGINFFKNYRLFFDFDQCILYMQKIEKDILKEK